MRLGKSGKGRMTARTRARTPRRETVCFEQLESRILLSAAGPSIVAVTADNRGFVQLTADARLNEDTVNSSSVRIYTAGADGLLGTADDEQLGATVTLNDDVIRVRANVAADQRYRIVLDGSIIQDQDGNFLDGEFNGAGVPSGDGTEGGDFQIFTKRAQSRIVRFTTTQGIIDVRLFDDRPITVRNFLAYANAGDWDNTFFHRSASLPGDIPFVIQGGGFNADGFLSQVLSRGQIQNEPGRSNVRGTIAMAKLPDQPNSASNQWFFNLSDNSSNLDNQNGGFTVFGEIIDQAGLDVVDDIAALDTFDATSQGSAFNEVPVQDINAITGGQVSPDDLVRISRIALLVDFSGEPTRQLSESNGFVSTNPRGEARVTIYSLTGANLGDLSDSVRIRWGRNDSIQSITIRNGFTAEQVGLRIDGATSVNKFNDQRNGTTNLAFVMSNVGINTFTSRSSVTGFDLNDYYLEGGFQFDADIDSDGTGNDNLGLYIPEGSVNNLQIRSDLRGDVIIDGSLRRLDVRGAVQGSNLVIRGNVADGNPRPLNVRLGAVDDSNLDSRVAISSLSVAEWLNGNGGLNSISAPTIGNVNISGDLAVGIVTTQAPETGFSLGSVRIGGSVLGGAWDIAGDVPSINISGDVLNTTFEINGVLRTFSARSVFSSELSVDGVMNSVVVTQWDGGGITTDGLDRLDVRGDSRNGIAGNYFADLTITGAANTIVMNSARIAGDLGNGIWTITGDVRTVTALGNSDNWDFNLTGNLDVMTLNAVRDSSVEVSQTATRLQFDSWNGGDITGRTYLEIRSTGDRRTDDAGDFIANINLTTGIQRLTIAGNLQGTLSMRLAEFITVGGDMIDSSITFTQTTTTVDIPQALIRLDVGGQMFNSTLRARINVNDISVGAMTDSGIYVGAANNQSGLPDTATGVNADATINSIEVRGIDGQPASYVNSFIVAGKIGTVRVRLPQTENLGRPFGIAAGSIQRVETFFGRNDRVTSNNPSQTLAPRGDYQVRVNFAPPA